MDAGETPMQTARREAQEEAGLKLSSIESVAEVYASPGNSTEFYYIFCGLADLPDSVDGLATRAEARNLVHISAALAETTPQAVLDSYAGALFGHFKVALADLAVDRLAPISTEMQRLMDYPAEIDTILGRGAERAREIIEELRERAADAERDQQEQDYLDRLLRRF